MLSGRMVKGHNDALQMIEKQIEAAENDALIAHLIRTRQHLVMHLQEAKQLQSGR
jgi:hypothetical protein